MYSIEARLKTFEGWPFSDKENCSAKNMAQAGFYVVSGDWAKCYYCNKDLEGWEVDDVPYAEHKKRMPCCPFLQMFPEPVDSLTVEDLVNLEEKKLLYQTDQKLKEQIDDLEERKQLMMNQITEYYTKHIK